MELAEGGWLQHRFNRIPQEIPENSLKWSKGYGQRQSAPPLRINVSEEPRYVALRRNASSWRSAPPYIVKGNYHTGHWNYLMVDYALSL